MERWEELVLSVLENDDEINWSVVLKIKPVLSRCIDNYEEKFDAMKTMYGNMIKNGYAKV
jgi:hypothetical protein